jgi:hypothetical protein
MKLLKNLFAFIVLNVWLIPKGGRRYVSFCPGCGNASLLHAFGYAHCDVCDYRVKETA